MAKKRTRRRTHGGARDGAGRPAQEAGTQASERIIFRVTGAQALLLDEHASEEESRNQTARRLLLGVLESE